jgi:alanine-glyoxylate transaminase/serine-glyoxylate transaminase/serine-pyruvate transaminase
MSLDVPTRILLGPGPSAVHPRVLRALGTPLVGHLDPAFIELMEETKALLRSVFMTTNELTLPISATGSAGMEACLVNLLEPGDTAIVGVNGVFGTRMVDIVERCGATAVKVEAPWGRIIEPDAVAAAVRGAPRAKLVALVHAETSTGAWQPLDEIGRLVRDAGMLLVADTVTSLGGCPVQVDEWLIDACYTGTQKCLSCPPGLAPLTFGRRAVEILHERRTKVQSWYLDLTMIEKYWGDERVYHHTAPISMNYALLEALRLG